MRFIEMNVCLRKGQFPTFYMPESIAFTKTFSVLVKAFQALHVCARGVAAARPKILGIAVGVSRMFRARPREECQLKWQWRLLAGCQHCL
jgi:hypothetical protein